MRRSVAHTAIVASALGAAVLGCARPNFYRPGNLPAEYLAPVVENVQTLDLSRLANHAVSNELIDRGDVLDVTIETGYGESREKPMPVRVAEDGTANIPLIGKVELAGLELEAAEHAIAVAAMGREVYRNPAVTVVMKRQRVNRVTVIGAVEKPGAYELPRGSSHLLAALVAAEGLSDEAGPEVEIRRPELRSGARGAAPERVASARGQLAGYQSEPKTPSSSSSVRVDLVSAAREGNESYYLEDGDVVMVQRREPAPVHVIGLVQKPGEIEIPVNQDLRLLDALALAGGQSSQVADKVHVIRRLPQLEEPIVIEVSLREAKRRGEGNLRLAPGDVVSVEQTPATVAVGTINNFVRLGIGASVPLF